jgi:hypothetical protein
MGDPAPAGLASATSCSVIERQRNSGPRILLRRMCATWALAAWRRCGRMAVRRNAVFSPFVSVEDILKRSPSARHDRPSQLSRSKLCGDRTDGARQPLSALKVKPHAGNGACRRIEVAAHTGGEIEGNAQIDALGPVAEGRTCLRGAAGRDRSRARATSPSSSATPTSGRSGG